MMALPFIMSYAIPGEGPLHAGPIARKYKMDAAATAHSLPHRMIARRYTRVP